MSDRLVINSYIFPCMDVVEIIVNRDMGRVVQKAISANPGLKFNRLFILVCSA